MIVIPMAGASSRFFKAGYTIPKWKLPLGEKLLFDWSILSFASQFATDKFVIICRAGDVELEFLNERLTKLGVEDFEIVTLPALTRGQAETVYLGLEKIQPDADEAVTIFNIDTIRPGYIGVPDAMVCDGWIECFEGDGDHWSFVLPADDSADLAKQVAEKLRISNKCSTGMYYFSSYQNFLDAYKAELSSKESGELYVAPLYQRMIEGGLTVRFSVIPKQAIFFSGTPAEYEIALTQLDEIDQAFKRSGYV